VRGRKKEGRFDIDAPLCLGCEAILDSARFLSSPPASASSPAAGATLWSQLTHIVPSHLEPMATLGTLELVRMAGKSYS
jgi:hypothetical protein